MGSLDDGGDRVLDGHLRHDLLDCGVHGHAIQTPDLEVGQTRLVHG